MGKLKKILLFEKHVCPWWLAYSWDHRLRKLFHNPRQILKPYLSEGDKVADIGCGMGFFSIAMAEYVGSSGKVYAVDLQQEMLDVLKKRSLNNCYELTIETILANEGKVNINDSLDFILKKGGRYLLVEPKLHTSQKLFDEEVEICKQIGFEELNQPPIRASRAVLFRKK